MDLYPYQKETLHEAIHRYNGRALVALDMGLGKTPIAIKFAEHYREYPVVVVCPASLKLNWAEEFETWTPGLNVQVVKKTKDPFVGAVIIVSYETAAKRALDIALMKPKMVILDEAHYIKSRSAQRTKQLLPVLQSVKYRLLLTGTPVLNRPAELFTQLAALGVSFGDFFTFARRYCNAHKRWFGWDFSGSSNLIELNTKLVQSCMIRKRKCDVLTELPEKRRVRVAIDAPFKSLESETLVKLCEAALKACANDVPSALARLKKVAKNEVNASLFKAYSELGTKKMKQAVELITETAELEPVVVFAHHTNVVHGIYETLMKSGIPSAIIDGGTPLEKRHASVKDFQAGKLKVLVCSSAGHTGLTLTAASTMFVVELVWSPGAALQAEDRIHRIGQKKGVLIKYLVAPGTMDEAMWKSLNSKAGISHSVIDGVKESEFDGVENQMLGNYWDVVNEILLDIYKKKQEALW